MHQHLIHMSQPPSHGASRISMISRGAYLTTCVLLHSRLPIANSNRLGAQTSLVPSTRPTDRERPSSDRLSRHSRLACGTNPTLVWHASLRRVGAAEQGALIESALTPSGPRLAIEDRRRTHHTSLAIGGVGAPSPPPPVVIIALPHLDEAEITPMPRMHPHRNPLDAVRRRRAGTSPHSRQ